MSSIFKNAVDSIRMGVEDFQQQNPDRDISAVRNFYAGVLLLAKEALIRAAPLADPEIVLAAKLKPVPDGNGDVVIMPVGKATVDFQHIGQRAKDFGIILDEKALKELNAIRNDLEHRFSPEASTAIRAAISKAFGIVASLFRQLGENPVTHLAEAWATMLQTKQLYDEELKEARATLEKVVWHSPSVAGGFFKCGDCQSELIEQVDPYNADQAEIELRCRTCGENQEVAEAIERLLDDLFSGEAYERAKDGGDDGPIYACPACDKNTIVESEENCANCNEPLDYESECKRCGEGISIGDYLDGLDNGLCSWCSHMSDKIMRE